MMPGDPAAKTAAQNLEACQVATTTIVSLQKLAKRLDVVTPAVLITQ
jgi:hypothetical protein